MHIPPDTHRRIEVRGAREHNLQGVDLDLPRDALVVITGLSGSGKSSLAFDTIYQEGQRRFLESLSSYARQFLGSMEKPRVERVDGLSPTLCIDQKTVNRNPRSTVGTITEIADHLRLWMARLGTPRCPVCRTAITRSAPADIADALLRDDADARLHVMAPIVQDRKGEYRKELADALAAGWLRARVDGTLRSLEDEIVLARYEKHTIELVIDRLRARPTDRPRLVEALERAARLADGAISLLVEAEGAEAPVHRLLHTARTCPAHGISIPEVEPRLFSFNAPQGMCPACSGIGWAEDFDEGLLIDATRPWPAALRLLDEDERVPFSVLGRDALRQVGSQLGLDPALPWSALPPAAREALLNGAPVRFTSVRTDEAGNRRSSEHTWAGILPFLRHTWHFAPIKRLEAVRRRVPCAACHGKRLNPVALAVDYRGRGIADLTHLTVDEARAFFEAVELDGREELVGRPILNELRARLAFLHNVGLGYLHLDRSAATLSGGEGQRIRLAGQVGAGLQGVTYVLDEPSIGLHGRDQDRLLDALVRLRDHGNSVLVVEHDTDTMARADWLVEIGPGAGREGGRLVAAGPPAAFRESAGLTARFLRGEETFPARDSLRAGSGAAIVLRNARENNLRGVDFRLPLGTLTVVTGVSGSGKSTLIEQTFCRAVAAALHGAEDPPGAHDGIDGLDAIDKLIRIDQSPIGRTPRSNPATYTGAFDHIRDLFSALPEARARGYTKGRFSFNVKGGRCEECEGAGVKTVEMQFLADVEVPCESCAGRRFNAETLELRYRGHTITEVLELTLAEAAALFRHHKKLGRILDTLVEVGLGYVALGQPSTTLSGGEAQRVKLATELARPATGRTLYVLDEPTTGLHPADVRRLLASLQRLVDAGNTVLVVEHNPDIILAADHLVDLGPEGGDAGGRLCGEGPPAAIAALDTPTGRFLARLRAAPAGAVPLAAERPPRAYGSADSRAISLRNVRTHNLKGVDIDLPKGALTVITGPSGSGKTSLAFDTLFAEGQRRYVESLSTYARRFLGRMDRPPLDRADGLAPAIAIDQKNQGHNPRSTVATVTEAWDAMRLLYARVGRPHCPRCAHPLRGYAPSAAARHLHAAAPGAGWVLARPPTGTRAADLQREGFTRAFDGAAERTLEALVAAGGDEATLDGLALVVDRLDPATAAADRVADAVKLAYGYGRDEAVFHPRNGAPPIPLSRAARCPTHGLVHAGELTPRHFSFNAHLGACPRCDGLGRRVEIDRARLLPAPTRPLEDALDPRVASVLFRVPRNRALLAALYAAAGQPLSTPWADLPAALQTAVLDGDPTPRRIAWVREWGGTRTAVEEQRPWDGLLPTIEGWAAELSWLKQEGPCIACGGGRLAPAILAVTLGDAPSSGPGRPPGKNIAETHALTVAEARRFWSELRLGPSETTIAAQPIEELLNRLRFLEEVGLGYLGLARAADTLSGGETQRIRLATQLGSRLTGTIYVLDEPTIGLHPRDTARLLATLRGLRDLGNTLVVVEHDPAVIATADHLVDMGPGAGEHGGRIVAQGTPDAVAAAGGLTGDYLAGRRAIPSPAARREPQAWLEIPPSSLHNLKDTALRLPLGVLVAVTGVSGSGKSTLVLDHAAPWLQARAAADRSAAPIVCVDQSPIGRTPRSTPATFCEIMGPLRTLFADTPAARARGWGPSRFSFNGSDDGRCPHCEGRGLVQIEMHFLSDLWVRCDKCGGRRYTAETLEVRWRGLSIADVLDLPAAEAREVFAAQRAIRARLDALVDVGLGYLRLGQDASTLSGGEAQRLKLATELVSRKRPTIYILDEPTTGLHLDDVARLLEVLNRLVDAGHTVVLVEHHLDLIRNADWVIDLGPEAGEAGGQIIAAGPPGWIAVQRDSWTGRALAGTLDGGGPPDAR